MKVIFLDFDGVIMPGYDRTFTGGFDPLTIVHLNNIIEKTDAHIVISSSYRHACTMESLKQWLEEEGVKGVVLGRTPFAMDIVRRSGYRSARESEISSWLENWKGEPVEKFVILDDIDEFHVLKDALVQTDKWAGLTGDDAIKAVDKLTQM